MKEKQIGYQDGASDTIKNLCKSIYKYYEAACAYKSANP